jgi:hypothetical protein
MSRLIYIQQLYSNLHIQILTKNITHAYYRTTSLSTFFNKDALYYITLYTLINVIFLLLSFFL